MATSFASWTNTFVPTFAGGATSKLIVEFSRNPKDFAVNALTTQVPVDKPIGYFLKIKPEAQARIINSPQSYVWPDGQPCPIQQENESDFQFVKYFAQRYAQTDFIGYRTAELADWDVEAQKARNLANRIMLMRTVKFYDLVQDSTLYDSSHVATATALGGGQWSAATSANRYIMNSLLAAAQIIVKDTVNAVGLKDLVLIVGPAVARKMAASAEIADYLAQSVPAEKFLTFENWQGQNKLYGLPPELYGMKIMVDETVKDTARIGATSNKAFAPGDTSAYIITKPGSLSGPSGGIGFSSVASFISKEWEMRTETIDVPIDARKILRVADEWDMQLIAPETAFLITSTVA